MNVEKIVLYGRIREMLLTNQMDAIVAEGAKTVVPPLLDALKRDDAFVRRHAAEALGELAARTAIPALVAALNDVDGEVQTNSAWALGRIAERSRRNPGRRSDACLKAIPHLIEALNKNFAGRGSIAYALAKIAAKNQLEYDWGRVASALARVLNDPNDATLDSVASSLGILASKTKLDLRAVENALKERVDYVRRERDPQRTRIAERLAIAYYIRISKAAGKSAAERHSLAGDGILLEARMPQPKGKIYRSARSERVFA